MRKSVVHLTAFCGACLLAFCVGTRAADTEKKEIREFPIEKDGKLDVQEWLAAAKGEEAAIATDKEAKRAELWRPALKHLKEKLEALKDAREVKDAKESKTDDKESHSALAAIRENHPLLWERLVERVRTARAAEAAAIRAVVKEREKAK